ncbi:MAG: TraR/DksA C4-type zinc finger protein [Bacteroidales bacterium]|nr:TraR/DksA C4-type zinc finger protein [Bacteroidales bacterium]
MTEETKERYSDEELQEFKELILKKIEEKQNDFDFYKNMLNHESSNDIADTSPTFKQLEEGASVLSKEELSNQAQRLQKIIQSLQAALVRIENGTYGICRETGKLILKERLMAVPHATLSIEAKENRDN